MLNVNLESDISLMQGEETLKIPKGGRLVEKVYFKRNEISVLTGCIESKATRLQIFFSRTIRMR